MREIDWDAEPDLNALKEAYGLFDTNPERAIAELEKLASQGSRMSMFKECR